MLTHEQARARLKREGISLAYWARKHGFDPAHVYQFLSGKALGVRGRSHNIAVLLGVKRGVVNDPAALADRKSLVHRKQRRRKAAPAAQGRRGIGDQGRRGEQRGRDPHGRVR